VFEVLCDITRGIRHAAQYPICLHHYHTAINPRQVHNQRQWVGVKRGG